MLAVSFSLWGDRPEAARSALAAAALLLPTDALPGPDCGLQRPWVGSEIREPLLGKGEDAPGERVHHKKPLISRAMDLWRRTRDLVSYDSEPPATNPVKDALSLVLKKPTQRYVVYFPTQI